MKTPYYQVSLVNTKLDNTIPACVVSGWHATSFNPSGDQIQGLKSNTTHIVRVRVAYDFNQYIKSIFIRAGITRDDQHPIIQPPNNEPLRSKWSTSLHIDTAPLPRSDNTLEGYDVKEEDEATFQRLGMFTIISSLLVLQLLTRNIFSSFVSSMFSFHFFCVFLPSVDDLLASDNLSSRAHALMNLTTFVSLAAAAERVYPSLGYRLSNSSPLRRGGHQLWDSKTRRAF